MGEDCYDDYYEESHCPSGMVEWGLDECGNEQFVSASWAKQVALEEGL